MKFKKLLIIGLLTTLVLSGCGKKDKEVEVNTADTEITNIEVSTPTPTPEKIITHEATDAEKLFEESKSSMNEYVSYYPMRSSFLINHVNQYTEDKVTNEFILDSFAKSRGLEMIRINNFVFDKPEEQVTYHNGVPSISYDSKFIAYMDLNEVLQNYIDSQTTPLGEWYELYSLVDTLCAEIGCEGIVITTNGAPFHMMHYTFKEDEPIYFSTKLSESLDKFENTSEIEFSKLVETYKDLGYNITRADYNRFWSAGGDIEGLEMSNIEETTETENIEETEEVENSEDEASEESSEETEEDGDEKIEVIGG